MTSPNKKQVVGRKRVCSPSHSDRVYTCPLFGGPTPYSEERLHIWQNERDNALLWDVELQGSCGGKVHASRLDLAVWSRRFRAKFSGSFRDSADKTIMLQETDRQTLHETLEALYSHKVKLSWESVGNMLHVSDSLGFLAIKEACMKFLQDEIDENTVIQTLNLADTFGCETLRQTALEYLLSNFEGVLRSKESAAATLSSLPKSVFMQLLNSDMLVVQTEMAVFRAIKLWLTGQKSDAEQQKVTELLMAMRLEHMKPEELHQVLQDELVRNDLASCQMLAMAAIRVAGCPQALPVPRRPLRTLPLLHRWCVEGWLPLFQGARVNEVFSSPPFLMPGCDRKWKLDLYPKGQRTPGTVALYLSLVDKLGPGECEENNYMLHIINQLNVTKTLSKKMRKPFTREDDNWGYQNFCAAQSLMISEPGYLLDGCIVVGVTRASDANSVPWSSS